MPAISRAEQIKRQGGNPLPSDYTMQELEARRKQLQAWLDKVEAEIARRQAG